MDLFSIWHWLIVLIIVLLLFGGRGKVSAVMGDLGKGLKAFKKSMQDEEGTNAEAEAEAPKVIESKPAGVVEPAAAEERKDKDKAIS